MKIFKNKVATLSTAGAVLAASLTMAMSPASAATDIKVGVIPINSMGAIQYAQDAGIFKKNGLDVTEFVAFPAPPPTIAALAAGAIQFAYTPTIPAINAYENGGIALRIVAAADGYSTRDLSKAKKDAAFAAKIDDTGVCVKSSSSIKRWKDLVGKTVSVPARGAQAEVTIAAAVKADGGDASKINWVTLGFPQVIPSVDSGAVDAGFTVEPFTSQCATSGNRNIGAPGVQFFTVERAIGVWVTTQDYYNSNRAAVRAFQKSIYEANSYAMKSKANMRKVTLASTKITEVSPAVALAANPTYYPVQVTRIDVARPAQKMLDLGFLTKKPDIAGLLVRQYRP